MSTPIGPYTPIVRAGPWLICSGQLGLAPGAEDIPPVLVEGGAAAQLDRALANGRDPAGVGEGSGLGGVVKTTVFVTDMAGVRRRRNRAYATAFGDHRPARSVVGVVALPMGAAVEVEVWAYVGSA